MPEELAKASGIEYMRPLSSPLGLLGNRWGLRGSGGQQGRSENIFSAKGDLAAFLEVLRARCEVWDMEGVKDWRRREAEEDGTLAQTTGSRNAREAAENLDRLEAAAIPASNLGRACGQSRETESESEATSQMPKFGKEIFPRHYYVAPSKLSADDMAEHTQQAWGSAVLRAAIPSDAGLPPLTAVPWASTYLQIFRRNVFVPRHHRGVTMWTFSELCNSNLGPADYISLASNFHTLILDSVPILTLIQKNEARRFITLLDALYEARCKLLIRAEAGPDDIFFPETRAGRVSDAANDRIDSSDDGVYSEVFSEIYQDQTSPFRPNISSYTSSASHPSSASYPPTLPPGLPSTSHSSNTSSPSTGSTLADEDSDFGPVYGAGRFSGSHGPNNGPPGAGNEVGSQGRPDFGKTGIFTGDDERFAYKRARSRLWEMCGRRWWERSEGGWWRPVSRDVRRWEGDVGGERVVHRGSSGLANKEGEVEISGQEVQREIQEEKLFRHGASPFRTSQEPPPKFAWVHAWGMMKWGKKAGAWGKGPEGLEEEEENKKKKAKRRHQEKGLSQEDGTEGES